MKFLTVFAIASALSLSACKTTMELPDGQTLRAQDVCRNLSSKKCVPNVGNAKRLKKDVPPLGLEGDVKSALLSYLGTVIRSDEKVRGSRGGVCGGLEETVFTEADIVATRVKDANIEWEAFDGKRHWIWPEKLETDIKQALKESGATMMTRMKMWSEIDVARKSLRAQKLRTRSVFYQYHLKDETLRQLETARYSSRFKPCLMDLQTGGWRLYQAITGFQVEGQRFDERAYEQTLKTLSQEAVNIQSDLDAVQIETALNRILTTRLNAEVSSYFQPVGVSFWESRRFRVIG